MAWIDKLSKRSIGQYYETLAENFLKKHQLKTVKKNYTCPQGEIDLIMLDAGTLVFVEVKYRKSANYGESIEMISSAKMKKIKTAAQHYLQTKSINENSLSIRFDAIAINSDKQVNWIQNIY